MTYHEMREVLRAAERKEQIQCKSKISDDSPWKDIANPSWNFHSYDYRTKSRARRWWMVLRPNCHPVVFGDKTTAEQYRTSALNEAIVEVEEVIASKKEK